MLKKSYFKTALTMVFFSQLLYGASPSLADIPNQTIDEDSGLSIVDINATDSDNDKLTITVTSVDNNLVDVKYYSGLTQIGDDIDGESFGDLSGNSVSISADGSIVAIGANGNDGNGNDSGHVRVYKNISGVWTQIGDDIDGESFGDLSGNSVSISADGSIVAIGANGNDGNGSFSGHVRVYKNISGVWTQIGDDIDGEASGDRSGYSVSLSSDGSIVAIGAFLNDGNGSRSGHVRVYKNISGVWTQIGDDIDGEAANDKSGTSVSLSADGSVVAIGATNNNNSAFQGGHVRVYKNISGVWTQMGQDIDGESSDDYSGNSVSLSADGSVVAIGARTNHEVDTSSGHVRVYKYDSGVWIQIGEDIDGESVEEYLGTSVSLSADGSIVAIGATGYDNGKGQVKIYKNNAGKWEQLEKSINGEDFNSSSGTSVSLSADGSIVAIGANGNDGTNGYDSGHVRVYNTLKGLAITPKPNAHGQTTVSVKVSDGSNEITKTFNLTINPVNDLPLSTNIEKIYIPGDAFSLSQNDFTFSDVETSNLHSIQITSMSGGKLTLNNTDVTINQIISSSDISNLKFTEDNGAKSATIKFKVGDGEDYSANEYNLNIAIVTLVEVSVNEDEKYSYDLDSSFTWNLKKGSTLPNGFELKQGDGNINLFAGTLNSKGNSGDGSDALSAKFGEIAQITFDKDGNLYIADLSYHVIRKIDTKGIVTTIAGTGSYGNGGSEGVATQTALNQPYGVAVANNGDVYISDRANHVIKKVDAKTGMMSIIAGILDRLGNSDEEQVATAGKINKPNFLAINNNILYITSSSANRIKTLDLDTGMMDSLRDINGDVIDVDNPFGIDFDRDGNIYVNANDDKRVEKIDRNGNKTTVLSYDDGVGVVVDNSGNVYGVDYGDHSVVMPDADGKPVKVAGTGGSGHSGDGALATLAKLDNPRGIAIGPDGKIYVADSQNYVVRSFTLPGYRISGLPINADVGVHTFDVESNAGDTVRFKITVENQNDAPLAKDVNISFGDTKNFKASDFGVIDVDNDVVDNEKFEFLKIVSLPSSGTLRLDGNDVNIGDSISTSDLANLVFTYEDNASGHPTFTFKVNDGDVDSPKTYTATLNNAPTFDVNKSVDIVNVGGKYEYIVDVSDSDDDITSSKVNSSLPSWLKKGAAYNIRGVGVEGISDAKGDIPLIAIDSKGTPYILYKDDFIGEKATLKKFDGNSWITVGTQGFSDGKVRDLSLAISSSDTIYVAYRDITNSSGATVKKFDGSSWKTVGSEGSSSGVAKEISIAVDSKDTPYIIYHSTFFNKAQVKKFNGTTWESLGNELGISIGTSENNNIVIDSNDIPYVAFKDMGNAIVKKFNGTSWEDIASANISNASEDKISLAIDNNDTLYISYVYINKVTVKKYDGNSWITVGEEGFSDVYSSTQTVSLAVDSNNTPYVAFEYNDKGIVSTIKRFDGNSWLSVEDEKFNKGDSYYTNIAIDGLTPYVVYRDNLVEEKAVVKKFDTKLKLVGTPTSSDAGVYDISLSSNDGYTSTSQNYQIKVVKTQNIDTSVNTEESKTFKASDLLLLDDSIKSIIITALPTKGTISLAGSSVSLNEKILRADFNKLSYISNNAYIGKDSLSFELFNSENKYLSTNKVNIKVNDIPKITSTPTKEIKVDNKYEYNINIKDSIKNKLSVKLKEGSTLPSWLKLEDTSAWLNVGAKDFSSSNIFDISMAIDSKGTPYVAYKDISFRDSSGKAKATVMKFDGNSWVIVGEAGFTEAGADKISIKIDSNDSPHVLYLDSSSGGRASMMKFNGTSWEQVGAKGFSSGFSANSTDEISFTIDNTDTLYMTYYYKSGAYVMKYNGTSWEDLAKIPSVITRGNYPSIVTDSKGVPYLAYSYLGKVSVVKYNGVSWENVSSSEVISSKAILPRLVIDSKDNLYIAYGDIVNSRKVSVRKFNSSSWVQVGKAGFTEGEAKDISMTIDSNDILYITYKDNSAVTKVMKFNGNSWVRAGNTVLSDKKILASSIDVDNFDTPYVAYRAHTDKANVKKYVNQYLLSGTATQADVGTYDFTLVVDDGLGGTSEQKVNIKVTGDSSGEGSTPAPKQVTLPSSLSTNEDVAKDISFTYSGFDSDVNVVALIKTQGSNGVVSIPNAYGTTIKYTPKADFNGSDSFVVTLTDKNGFSVDKTVRVTVNPVNDLPVITFDPNIVTNVNTQGSTTLSYTDVDSDKLVMVFDSSPKNGTVVLDGTTFKYTPDKDFVGTDSFMITIVSAGFNEQKTINIKVNKVEEKQVTIASSLSTNEDEAKDISFTYSGFESDASVVALIKTQGSNGVVSIPNKYGTTIKYTPKENFNGNDSFVVTLTDKNGFSEDKTISVTVSPVNDAPTITSSAIVLAKKDELYTYTLSANDVDNDTLTWKVNPNKALPSWLSLSSNVLSGTVTQVGNYDVSLILNDGTVDIEHNFTIDVSSSDNIAPKVSSISFANNSKKGPSLIEGDKIIFEVEFDEVVLVNGTPSLNFNIEGNEHKALYTLGNNSKVLTFTYTTPNSGLSVPNMKIEANKIALNGGSIKDSSDNDAISISKIANKGLFKGFDSLVLNDDDFNTSSFDENLKGFKKTYGPRQPVSLNVQINKNLPISEYDVIDTQKIQVDNLLMSLTFNTRNEESLALPFKGVSLNLIPSLGADSWSFKVDDFTYSSVIETVNKLGRPHDTVDLDNFMSDYKDVIIKQMNNAMKSSGLNETIINAQSKFVKHKEFILNVPGLEKPLSVDIEEDISINEDRSKTISFTSEKQVSVTEKTAPSNGSIKINENNLVYIPNTDFNGKDSFVVTFTSGEESIDKTVSVTVNTVNDAPKILSTLNDENKAEDFVTFTKDIAISDVDNDDLTLIASTQSDIITLSSPWSNPLNANEYNANSQTLSINSIANKYGTAIVKVNVSDGTLSDTKEFKVNVPAVLDFPSISSEKITVNEDFGIYNITLNGIDLGSQTSGTITVVADNKNIFNTPNPISINTSDNGSKVITLTSKENIFGDTNITITVDNNVNTPVSKKISVSVKAVNDLPQISGTAKTSINEGEVYSFTPIVSDIDSEDLSFTIENKPSWLSFDRESGKLSGTASSNDVGVYKDIKISVIDGLDQVALPVFNITVASIESINNDPVISINTSVNTYENVAKDLNFTYTDEDGDTVVATLKTQASNGTIIINAQTITYTPNENFKGNDSFVVTFSDENGFSVDKTISVRVKATNDALCVENTKTALVFDLIKNANSFQDSVSTSLNLIDSIESICNSRIRWESSDEKIVSNDGSVSQGDKSKTIELLANIVKGDFSSQKSFLITVPKTNITDLEALKKLTFNMIKEENRSKYKVISSLDLISSILGKDITWESSDENTISPYSGYVTRSSSQDKKVTLTARISGKPKVFNLKVLKLETTNTNIVQKDKDLLTYDSILGKNKDKNHIVYNLVKPLPLKAENGSTISWESSNPNYITTDGDVFRDENKDKYVTLTATITKDDLVETKEFEFLVLQNKIKENSKNKFKNASVENKQIKVITTKDAEEIETTSTISDELLDIVENIVSQESIQSIAQFVDKVVNVYLNNDGTSQTTMSNTKGVASLNNEINGANTQVNLDEDGNGDITSSANTLNGSIKLKLQSDGSVSHEVISKNQKSSAKSTIASSEVISDDQGTVQTSSELKKDSILIKAVVTTKSNGETKTKFVRINTLTGEETDVANTLEENSSYPLGNEVEISELNGDLYIKTTTPVNGEIEIK